MMILLACDCQTKANKLRHAMERNGYDCPLANVVPLSGVTRTSHKPDLIVVVLPANQDEGQDLLKRIREWSEANILAVGPRDSNLILGVLRAGANDFLDDSGDIHSEFVAAMGRLAASHHARSSLGQLIVVAAGSGGSGRTLLASNLAVALAKLEGRSALFDFDLAGADAATQMNLKPRHTVADLCRNVDKLDQKMFEQSLLEHEHKVAVLAGPETWDAVTHVSVEGLEKSVRFGRAMFPNVVVDLNPFWLGEYAGLLRQSTTILLLCRLDLSTLRNTRRALDHLDRIGVSRANLQLVVTRYGRSKEISVSQAESVLESEFRHYVPEDASTVNSCINCGVPVVVEMPSCSVSKAVSGIAKAVVRTSSTPAAVPELAANGHVANPIVEKVRTFIGLSVQALAHNVRVSNPT